MKISQNFKKKAINTLKHTKMPNLPRIKSSQRRCLLLLAFTFLVGTMITVVNYNQSFAQQRFALGDNERTALLNYFKYTQLKRNLVSSSDSQVNKLSESDFRPPQALTSSLKNAQSSQLANNQQQAPVESVSNNKISSTTFSDDKKESSTKFLINRDNRDVNSGDFGSQPQQQPQQPSKPSNELDKLINSSKKLITPAPNVQQPDKIANLTASSKLQPPDAKQKLAATTLMAKKPTSFVHTEAELELTQKFVIDKKNFCSGEHGYGLDLLVMVVTSPANFDARSAIRQTWGGFAVERGSKLLFVVGRSPSPEINERLKQEDTQFEDILQAQFQDAYYNLTLKSLAILNWVADNCEKTKYVLKVDDDMFVNMQLLVDFAETREFKNVIIGKVAKKWLPHRDPVSKWYVPSTAYAGQVYPNFATGPAYLIHRDAIPNLAKVIRSNMTKVIKLEDVFLAGIVAEKAGVRRLNYSLFKNAYFEVTKCYFMRFITSHAHSPKEIIRLWTLVYSDKKVDCTLKKVAVTKAPLITKRDQSKLVVKPPVQIKKQPTPSDKTKTSTELKRQN